MSTRTKNWERMAGTSPPPEDGAVRDLVDLALEIDDVCFNDLFPHLAGAADDLIGESEVGTRAYNALQRNKRPTWGSLSDITVRRLASWTFVGTKTVRAILAAAERRGHGCEEAPALRPLSEALDADARTLVRDDTDEVPRRSTNRARDEEIVQLRRQGLTLAAIGAKVGVTRERVRQILASHPNASTLTVPRSTKKEAGAKQDATLAAAIEHDVVCHLGTTIEEAASRLGCDASTIRRLLPSHVRQFVTTAPTLTQVVAVWSHEDIMRALTEAQTYEFPLSTAKYEELVRRGAVAGPSVVRIMQRYGTWSAACVEAGVEPFEARRDSYESNWTDDDLYRFVLQFLFEDASPGTFAGFEEWARDNDEAPSAQTIRNRLGPWNDVKRTALREKLHDPAFTIARSM